MKVVKKLKYIDKFLKKLKTDRNTFLTYVLTLVAFYLCVDSGGSAAGAPTSAGVDSWFVCGARSFVYRANDLFAPRTGSDAGSSGYLYVYSQRCAGVRNSALYGYLFYKGCFSDGEQTAGL